VAIRQLYGAMAPFDAEGQPQFCENLSDHLRKSPTLSFERRIDPLYTYPREDTLVALVNKT
jgi:hypothetical protein